MTGHHHPLTILEEQIIHYFQPYGFEVYTGSEIVSPAEAFDILNIPPDHPARTGFDTFYINDQQILTPHATALYASALKAHQPPLRLLFPSRCFRNEATDATHDHTFYQIDGLVIDNQTNLANLVASLEGMMRHLLGPDLEFRIRSSYFPFTEPSIELDIKQKGGQWLEMLGAGMVNPKVIKNLGLDPTRHQGYAFGFGYGRILNVGYNVDDFRLNLTGDYRYLGQFK